ncbi:MAG: hypothetical protein WCD08_08480 [Steroidobacteraceae bacterium]
MKNFSRSAPVFACAALGGLACLAGASVAAAAGTGPRILGLSDMMKLSDKTEDQLEAAKEATRKYKDINVALAEGFFQATPSVPGEGFHYLNPARVDCKFDPAHPEVLLYAFLPGQTQLKLVAVEWLMPFDCMPKDGPPPEGFAGNLDVWGNDEPVPFWTLNAWLYFRNPNGLFTLENPRIP